MKHRYTDEELSQYAQYYEEHGVVRLPGLIDPEWVQRILTTIDTVAARADEVQKPGSALSFGRADGRMTIRYMWREIPEVRKFLLRDELAKPIARVVNSKTLRLWFDLTFMHLGSSSGAAGAGTPWHHDIAAFPFKGMHVPSLWMAMTPSDAQRSRLEFIDGSHKTVPGFYRTPDSKRPANGMKDGYLELPDFDGMVADGSANLITWDCEPGDAIVIHPYTIHGAKGNAGHNGNDRRVAITTRWLGDDARFLPTAFAPETPAYELAMRSPGMVESNLAMGGVAAGDYFPMVWDESPA